MDELYPPEIRPEMRGAWRKFRELAGSREIKFFSYAYGNGRRMRVGAYFNEAGPVFNLVGGRIEHLRFSAWIDLFNDRQEMVG
ncbi:MAG TPA: hypothetical protein VMH36_09730 [Alphaproteobacteria bacterium]|nr:hypothetical protein [Alphaproteobacteria bacterium]